MSFYLNLKTGEVVTVGQEKLWAAEDGQVPEGAADWEREAIELARSSG